MARRGAVASFSSAFWREKEDNRQGGGWAGPASTAGRTGRWAEVSARLVLLSLSFIFFLFSLFFSAICFGFSFNTKPFYKILKIIMWLELKYTKPHKMFQNYWTYINYI